MLRRWNIVIIGLIKKNRFFIQTLKHKLRDDDPHPPWSIPILVVLPQCYKLSHCMLDNKFQAIALCIIKHAVEWSYPFVTNYLDICATAT